MNSYFYLHKISFASGESISVSIVAGFVSPFIDRFGGVIFRSLVLRTEITKRIILVQEN